MMAHPVHSRQTPLAAELLGVVVLALGAVAGFGYVVDLPTAYQWGYATGMAVHTAAGFIVLGMGIIAYAWGQYRSRVVGTLQWLPGIVGIGITVITLYLWQALIAHEHTLLERKVTIAKAEVTTPSSRRSGRAFGRWCIWRRWEVGGQPRQDEWETDVMLHVRDYPGLQAIAWADASFTVQWVAPGLAMQPCSITTLGLTKPNGSL